VSFDLFYAPRRLDIAVDVGCNSQTASNPNEGIVISNELPDNNSYGPVKEEANPKLVTPEEVGRC
jgi:hypothetical protein